MSCQVFYGSETENISDKLIFINFTLEKCYSSNILKTLWNIGIEKVYFLMWYLHACNIHEKNYLLLRVLIYLSCFFWSITNWLISFLSKRLGNNFWFFSILTFFILFSTESYLFSIKMILRITFSFLSLVPSLILPYICTVFIVLLTGLPSCKFSLPFYILYTYPVIK